MCSCNTLSPFRWRERTSPSIFMRDTTFRPRGARGMTISQLVTESVEERREGGHCPGYISGIARDSDAEMARLNDFIATTRRRKKEVTPA